MAAASYKKMKIMNMSTGFGAAIVIVGAMFKIMHWPGASVMLVAGLTTEALLFIMGAFEEPHMETDWSLVYPELATNHGADEDTEAIEEGGGVIASGDPIAQKLDEMLMDANIGGELVQSLGDGLRSFSTTAKNLNSAGDASVASDEFVSSLKGASASVGKLSDSYSKASETLTDLVAIEGQGVSYGEQLTHMTKNLSELNAVYEQQIAANNDSGKLSAEISKNITELMLTLNDSVEDTKRFKSEVATLGDNLGKLNTVYGNMLTAMNQ
ncbi:MAG: gliding motility-associated protein GldL [Glaciecola sp.]|jgi:gliding motility-associated protein GldL